MATLCGVCEQDGLERAFAVEESLLTHVQTVHAHLIEEDAEQAAKTPPGANAPYKIQKRGAKFVVVNNTGEVKATFDNRPAALKYLAALYANVKGAPKRAAGTKFTGKAKDRVPAKESASAVLTCTDEACGRQFVDKHALYEHAEAVHTFSDTTRILSEYLRETYGRRGDYRAEPPIPSIYCWVEDIATDWVVFSVESDDSSIYKASYSISADNKVTLGAPVEVVRRTVYDPVSDSDPLPTPTTTGS